MECSPLPVPWQLPGDYFEEGMTETLSLYEVYFNVVESLFGKNCSYSLSF